MIKTADIQARAERCIADLDAFTHMASAEGLARVYLQQARVEIRKIQYADTDSGESRRGK